MIYVIKVWIFHIDFIESHKRNPDTAFTCDEITKAELICLQIIMAATKNGNECQS